MQKLLDRLLAFVDRLTSDAKFWWAAYVLIQTIVMTYEPNINPDILKQVDGLVLILIGAYTGGKVMGVRSVRSQMK